MSQFQFGNFENRGGGLYFSKMSQLQLFDSVFCNITFIRNVWNSKMSQFGQRGGGQHFSKMSEIQKCPKGRRGVNPNWDIVPNFLDFQFWCLFISEILGGCKDLKYRQPSKPLTSPCIQGCCWNIFLLCHCFFSWKCSLSWRQGQDIWNQQKHLIIFCLIMYHSNSLSPMLWSLIFYNNLITHSVLICLLMPRLVSACQILSRSDSVSHSLSSCLIFVLIRPVLSHSTRAIQPILET